MQKKILITGNQNTGKTEKAKLMSIGKSMVISASSFNEDIKFFDDSISTIILDEVVFKRDFDIVKSLISKETIKFRKPYESKSKEYEIPNVIICTQENGEIILDSLPYFNEVVEL